MAPFRIPPLSALGPLVETKFIVSATEETLFLSLNNDGPVRDVEIRLSRLDSDEGVTFSFRDTRKNCLEKINEHIMARLRQDQRYIEYENELKRIRELLLCGTASDSTFLQKDVRDVLGPGLDLAQFRSQCETKLGSNESTEKPIEWPTYPEELVQTIVSQVFEDRENVCSGASS